MGYHWHSVFAYINNSSNNPCLSAMGSLANIIIAVIGLLNLLLLFRIFLCEQSERIKAANHQERLYWVRLALANEWDSVNVFFKKEYDIVDKMLDVLKRADANVDDQIKALFQSYSDAIRELRRTFGNAFCGVDAQFSEQVNQVIDDIQDEYTKHMEMCQREYSEAEQPDKGIAKFEDLIAKQKKRVWSFVFTFSARMPE